MSALDSKGAGVPRAATGHMPFPGHRTVATVWSQEKTYRKSMEYGFDPVSLKAGRV